MPDSLTEWKQHYADELRQMLHDRGSQPKEKIMTVFCQRHGISMEECKKYYDQLMAQGDLAEKR